MQAEQPNTPMSDAEAAVVVRELEILKSLFVTRAKANTLEVLALVPYITSLVSPQKKDQG